jgi:hypothetical protein
MQILEEIIAGPAGNAVCKPLLESKPDWCLTAADVRKAAAAAAARRIAQRQVQKVLTREEIQRNVQDILATKQLARDLGGAIEIKSPVDHDKPITSLTVESVVEALSRYSGIPAIYIRKIKRSDPASLVPYRCAAIALVRLLTSKTIDEIGKAFNNTDPDDVSAILKRCRTIVVEVCKQVPRDATIDEYARTIVALVRTSPEFASHSKPCFHILYVEKRVPRLKPIQQELSHGASLG